MIFHSGTPPLTLYAKSSLLPVQFFAHGLVKFDCLPNKSHVKRSYAVTYKLFLSKHILIIRISYWKYYKQIDFLIQLSKSQGRANIILFLENLRATRGTEYPMGFR